ncbi:MAG: phosphoglycerate dehydrogenase [Candidatus Omnitrophica bacterium]|nr:phosphoglycerate dehydrogenase [Candidatus Omnitrophota bacterium]
MSKKIFVALTTFAQYGQEPVERLEKSGFDFTVNKLGRRLVKEEVIQYGQGCQGIIAGVEPYDADVIDQIPSLECISRVGVGLDNIDLRKAKEKGLIICNTPDVVIQPVAEMAVAMMFDMLRRLSFHTLKMCSKQWVKKAGNMLCGKTVGILGLGRIGRRVAEMMRKLDLEVRGYDVHPDQDWAKKNGVSLVGLDDVLSTADILSLHLASDKDHPFVLGSAEISKMKDGAMLINLARGQFVDEQALYDALKEEKLAGAALDVYSREPYDGPLCGLDSVILTPHVATLTKESRLQMEVEATGNLMKNL